MLTVKSEGPNFKKGDLAVLQDPDRIMTLGGLGIIVSDPVLIFIHDWECINEFPSKFWCYDIYVGEQLFREVPEQMLRGLDDEVKNKNFKRKQTKT